jgi:murein DD-endopeptidase
MPAASLPVRLGCALSAALLLAACASAPSRSGDAGVAEEATRVATSMVGKPYRHGGATPSGFDCSGLVSYSYGRAGLEVSRDTAALLREGRPVSRSELRRGDLLFFDQEGKKASHVGIWLGDGRFVHAPSSGGRVRTDRLDDPYWRRHFVAARRL